jgi:RNA polymerase sigma-70 factor (ECF subfamily)
MSDANPDSLETQRLLEQIQAGDRQAFEALFAQYWPRLRQFVEVRLDPRLRARVDASDVVQETQLEAFQRLGDYLARRPMPFHVWLHKTAYERVLKARRRHLGAAGRAIDREVGLPERSSVLLAQQLLAGGSTPSQRLSVEEAARQVRQALAELEEMDREVLLLRHLEGLAHEEAACILGIEPAAVRKRYGRALLRLRKLLVDRGLLESPP